jgi:hypothetical protein
MPRMTSSTKCVYVDILDDDCCVIGTAHAAGCANNDKFIDLLKELNELTDYYGNVSYFNPDNLED